MIEIQEYFNRITKEIGSLLRGNEVHTCSFTAEDSDFVRFNKNEIRQAGRVTDRRISLDLIEGRRHAAGSLTLTGDFDIDRVGVARLVRDLRDKRGSVPEDPYLLYSTDVKSTERHGDDRLPEPEAAITDIQKAGKGRDLVGIYAAGGIHSGFANSLGQRNWFTTYSHNFDWSFYLQADRAVKTGYAGFEWKPDEFGRKVDWASEQLGVLSHSPRTIQPGRYRVYLAPAAMNEVIGMMSWGGFGLKSHRTKQTPLIRMVEQDAQLHSAFTLSENTKEGVAPNFQDAGFLRPDEVRLIDAGAYRDCLVSPRSAKEYGVPTNGASGDESPQSVDVGAGDLPSDDVLRRLDTGIYINNL